MNNNREEIFDNNRRIIMENDQAIQQLQQIIEQNQREIEALRQQLNPPDRVPQFQLTADQVVTKFQRIKTFTGTDDYSLQEFISTVENTASLCNNNIPLMHHGLHIVFTEKIQGTAKRCVRRLGDNLTWETVKAELKAEFRPRKSYKKLYDECRNIRVSNLNELFDIIRSINHQLNELYEFDDHKPPNYSPENNDRNLVDIIKDMLTGSYRINIRHNMTINEVFNVFDELSLLNENDVIHYNYRKNKNNKHELNRRDFKRGFEKQTNNFHNNDNHVNQNKNFNQSHNKTNYGNNSGNFRRDKNLPNMSGQYRRYDNVGQRQFNHRQNFSNTAGQFRQGRDNNNYNNDNSVPMEIDNIQHEDVNFHTEPRTDSYR